VRQPRQQLEVGRTQLSRGPRDHLVGNLQLLTARECHQFPVGISTDQEHALTQRAEPVQHRDRLRPGGEITGHDDEVGGGDVRFGEHRVERGQHPVEIREDGDAVHHAAESAPPPSRGERLGTRLRVDRRLRRPRGSDGRTSPARPPTASSARWPATA
jgi:hypothetical protein